MRYGLNLYPIMLDIDINSPELDVETTVPASIKLHTLSFGFAANL